MRCTGWFDPQRRGAGHPDGDGRAGHALSAAGRPARGLLLHLCCLWLLTACPLPSSLALAAALPAAPTLYLNADQVAGEAAGPEDRPDAPWTRYRWPLAAALLLFLTLAGLVAALLRAGHQRNQALAALRDANEGLERRVRERTAELAESNARLAEAQAIARLGHWEWDLEADVLHWSEQVRRIFGRPLQGYTPSPAAFLEAVHADDRQRVRDQIERARRGGWSCDIEHRILRPDGALRYVQTRAVTERDGAGRPVALVGTVQDVSEWVRAAEQLRKLSRAVEQSHSTIVITDREARIEFANPAFSRITGYSLVEALGENPRLLQSGEHGPAFYQAMWDTLTRGEVWQGELHNKRKDGSLYWEFATISPVKDEQGVTTHYVAVKEDITQRKAAEAALSESRAKFRRLVEDLGDRFVVYSHTPDTHVLTYVSGGVQALSGLSVEEVIGRAWAKMVPWRPEDVAAIYRELALLMQGAVDGIRVEMRYRHPDGSERTLQVSSHAVWDEAGAVIAIEGIAEDISDRKRLEARLRAGEARLRAIIDAEPECIKLLDGAGCLLEMNPAGLAMIEADGIEAVLGRPVLELIAPEYREAYARLHAAVMAGQTMTLEFEVVGLRGGRRWLETHAVPLEDGGERVHLAVTRDISERKRAERQLEWSRAQLQISLEETQAVLDNVLVGIAFVNGERRFQRVNQALAAMFGYSEEELLGQTSEPFFVSSEAFRALGEEAYPILNAGGIFEVERPMRRRDGSLFWCQARGRAMQPGNLTKGFLWTLVDVSERHAVEQQLRQAKEAAEAANRAKSAFLANMSHELRTPLNAILGYAQILQRDPALNEAQRQGVDTIKRSGDYLLTLINDVLDLAKVEAGFLEMVPGPCDLPRFLRELAELFRLRAREKGIGFHYQCAAGLPQSVEVDEKRLRQVCINLLGNAIKFTERGEVRLEADYREGVLCLAVADTGIGIPEAMRERIFDPFQQAGDNKYKSQGTGLGLAISRTLVERMGGRIELESEPGRGSRFCVRLPLRVLDAPADVPSSQEVPVIGYRRTDGSSDPFVLLVVDDARVNRIVLRGMLEPRGFVVQEAGDGGEAVALALERPFDLILMDLVMPEMDGLAATRQILAQDGPHPPIVAVSGRVFDEDRAASLAAGCRDHLIKPVDLAALLGVLQTHLPLQWLRAGGGEVANPRTPEARPPLAAQDRDALLALAQRGRIGEIRGYLETLAGRSEAPAQTPELLRLAKEFKLAELRRQLSAGD